MHLNAYSSTIHDSQDMEAKEMSIDKWMDKEDVAYVYTKEYLLFSH